MLDAHQSDAPVLSEICAPSQASLRAARWTAAFSIATVPAPPAAQASRRLRVAGSWPRCQALRAPREPSPSAVSRRRGFWSLLRNQCWRATTPDSESPQAHPQYRGFNAIQYQNACRRWTQVDVCLPSGSKSTGSYPMHPPALNCTLHPSCCTCAVQCRPCGTPTCEISVGTRDCKSSADQSSRDVMEA